MYNQLKFGQKFQVLLTYKEIKESNFFPSIDNQSHGLESKIVLFKIVQHGL